MLEFIQDYIFKNTKKIVPDAFRTGNSVKHYVLILQNEAEIA
jgi:hypothetical protein